jgi:WD40 repeat protein
MSCISRPARSAAVRWEHDDAIRAISFSADMTRIITASDDKTARMWNASGFQLNDDLEHPGRVTSAAFSPDGMSVLTTSDGGLASIWDARSAPPSQRHWRTTQRSTRRYSALMARG